MAKKQMDSQGDSLLHDSVESESSEIIVSGPSALAVPSAPILNWEDPSDASQDADRTIPYFKLVQHTSEEAKSRAADVGDILSSTGINLGQWMVIVPLWFKRQASKFTDDRQLECQSLDGTTGSTYGACADCEFNYRQWGKDPLTKKSLPPKCSEVRSFPCLVITSDKVQDGASVGVIAVGFAKSSASVGKQLITQHDLTGLPFYGYRWKIGSKDKAFPKGSARVFTSEFQGRNPDDMMLQCQEICRSWAGASVAMPDHSEFGEEGSSETVDGEAAPF